MYLIGAIVGICFAVISWDIGRIFVQGRPQWLWCHGCGHDFGAMAVRCAQEANGNRRASITSQLRYCYVMFICSRRLSLILLLC